MVMTDDGEVFTLGCAGDGQRGIYMYMYIILISIYDFNTNDY
jgi:hypothetical protein